MTKKHYEAIAAIIASTYRNAALYKDAGRTDTLETIAARLADYFATDNKLFDRSRFLAACGIESTDSVAIDYHPGASHKDCATNDALTNPASRHYSGCYACGYTGR